MPTQQKDPVRAPQSQPDDKSQRRQREQASRIRRMNWIKRRAGFECSLVHRSLRFSQKLDRLKAWAKGRPEAGQLGEFLYSMGFGGEYTVLRAGRAIHRKGVQLGTWLGDHLIRIWHVLHRAAADAWVDITAPFKRFAQGLRNIRTFMKEEKERSSTAGAAKQGVGYFFRGLKLYAPLARRGLAYLMPVAALGVFVYTVSTVLNYNYVLAVEVNGDIVGYVQSESVFDEAKDDLTQRIQDASGADADWDIQPRYTIAVSDDVLGESAMVDAILAHSSDQIQDATALYVDGRLAAVTTEGDRLREELQSMLDEFKIPDKPEVVPEFQQHVETVQGVYFTDSIDDYSNISQMLHGEVEGEVFDQVRTGDSPSLIASRNDLTTQQLYDMNGGQDAVNNKMFPGEQLLVKQQVKFLTVQTVETITDTRPIKFETVEEKDDSMPFGSRKTVTEGVDGVEEYTINRYTRNGVVWDEPVESHVVTEPVTAVIKVGTKLPNGLSVSTGSGDLWWPVPNYTYVSRWMSSYHTGTDICAPYGSPIIASDSGRVVTATYHYSYGNYVVIDHGNGYRTLYAHASQLLVSPGQGVEQGQIIARVGSTGNSTGNHCHFELFRNGVRFGAQTLWGGGRRPV